LTSESSARTSVRGRQRGTDEVDAKRIELARLHGAIPTRSDVVRLALEKYLGVSLDIEADQRRFAARARRKPRRQRQCPVQWDIGSGVKKSKWRRDRATARPGLGLGWATTQKSRSAERLFYS